MSIKKKLGLGVASAALGLTLIGGGTWAAFNDTAVINNHFASGTLDLQVGKSGSKPINFDLSNMKPGDNVERIFKLNNVGSLAIKEVLLTTNADNFVDGTLENTKEEFLSQFEVEFMKLDSEQDKLPEPNDKWEPRANITIAGQTITLADLVNGNYVNKVKPEYLGGPLKQLINLAPLTLPNEDLEDYRGIPANPEDSDDVFIKITFKNDTTKINNEYVQNKYQGDSVDFFFNLEATQWDGVHVDTNHGNGAINNDVQGSADGGTMPTPRTEGAAKFTNAVID